VILVGNQRGGAKNLALHLMKDESDHVELHELRGFASNDLMGALNETYAISRGTRCKQFLYSLSFNPPKDETVDTETFEKAINKAEERLGLAGQPRAIVFHEKEGRRHAHAVWSRIDIDQMKAIQMSYDHKILNTLSRDLFLEHGWKMPRGLVNREERNPKNLTLAEWQQAKRIGKDPKAIKTAIQDAWAISDSKVAFTHALEERGYVLAQGDRRGFVAVDTHGEVYSIPKQAGIKTKIVRERLGEETHLPTVQIAKQQIADKMLPTLEAFRSTLQKSEADKHLHLTQQRQSLVASQRAEREAFIAQQNKRQQEEALQRQARFRKGLVGVWDFLRGENKRIRLRNEEEAKQATLRDRAQKDQFIQRQLAERRRLIERKIEVKEQFKRQQKEIKQDINRYQEMKSDTFEERKRAFIEGRRRNSQQLSRGPDLGR